MRHSWRSAVLVMLTALMSDACGSGTPTRPDPIASLPAAPTSPIEVLSLAGTWVGFMRIESCSLSGGCSGFVNRINDFSLTLTENGSAVTGHFQHGSILAFSADVAGTRNADGSVQLTGKTAVPTPPFGGYSAVITSLTVNRDRTRGVYATSFSYVATSAGTTTTFQAVIDSSSLGVVVVPPAPGAPLDGHWSGTIRTDVCSGNLCGKLPRSEPFQLTVIPSGELRALLTINPNISSHFMAMMTGAAQPDGSVVFSGSMPAAGPLVSAGPFVMSMFRVRVDAGGAMTGEFAKQATYDGRPPQVSSGVIVSGSHVQSVFSGSAFQGSWSGASVIRSCTGECDVVTVGKDLALSLLLSDAAGSISGAVNAVSAAASVFVRGPGTATSAILAGTQAYLPSCGPDDTTVICNQTLHNLTVTINEFGQMTGTMELYVDKWGYGPHRRYTITAELSGVVRVLF